MHPISAKCSQIAHSLSAVAGHHITIAQHDNIALTSEDTSKWGQKLRKTSPPGQDTFLWRPSAAHPLSRSGQNRSKSSPPGRRPPAGRQVGRNPLYFLYWTNFGKFIQYTKNSGYFQVANFFRHFFAKSAEMIPRSPYGSSIRVTRPRN